ncbi:Rpn family recombination-promoting nuclease/putative transposase [Clostridium magnum]|uniref:Rpn family recombination-promoting nuclease/putative transposase n=1 Tax=Clostridium magnum TaxID=33954 RepID=UPI00091417E5|nr:Rpn family recombination-promoting nuclease/putative transposase [Clostridium magnum]SHH65389.1 conserved hypothetical protein (putative transposase or invertase) [Clostridium magnum DSM 2767]
MEYIDPILGIVNAVDDKTGILDVRVKTEDGTHINVEIQLLNQYNMVERTLFYWSRLSNSQLKKGQNYRNLKRTITINILNFDYIDIEKFHSTFGLYEEELKIKLTDLMELDFIELPKFLKQQKDLEDSLQRWLLFLIKPNKEIFEEIEMKDPTIKKAKTILEFLERDAETVRLAELREKAIRDEISRIEGAREEGRDEGREEGKIEVAKKLLKMGMDILTVINATELKKEEIEKIKSSMN